MRILETEAQSFRERLPLLEPVYQEVAAIISLAQKHHSSRFSSWKKNWITNQTLFNARFGHPPERDAYGALNCPYTRMWWVTGGKVPGSEPDHFKVNARMKWRHLADIQNIAGQSELEDCVVASQRFLQSRPDPTAHLDIAGSAVRTTLLEHVSNHRGSKPTKKWLGEATAIVSDIGTERAAAALENWAQAVVARDLSWIDWGDARRFDELNFLSNRIAEDPNGGRFVTYIPTDTLLADETLIRRAALYVAGEWAQLFDAARYAKRSGSQPDYSNLAQSLELELDRRWSDEKATTAVGAIWLMSTFPKLIDRLVDLGLYMSFFVHDPPKGPRSRKAMNAVFWSLDAMGTDSARNAAQALKRQIEFEKS